MGAHGALVPFLKGKADEVTIPVTLLADGRIGISREAGVVQQHTYTRDEVVEWARGNIAYTASQRVSMEMSGQPSTFGAGRLADELTRNFKSGNRPYWVAVAAADLRQAGIDRKVARTVAAVDEQTHWVIEGLEPRTNDGGVIIDPTCPETGLRAFATLKKAVNQGAFLVARLNGKEPETWEEAKQFSESIIRAAAYQPFGNADEPEQVAEAASPATINAQQAKDMAAAMGATGADLKTKKSALAYLKANGVTL